MKTRGGSATSWVPRIKQGKVVTRIASLPRLTIAGIGTMLAGLSVSIFGATLLIGNQVAAAGSATLTLTPNSGSNLINSTLTLTVRENSGAEAVNAVQANLAYDPAKLEFQSISGSTSAFETSAESSGGAGTVKIGRARLGSTVTGNQIVAVVTFKVLGNSGTTAITFQSGSAIIRVSDYQDVWNGSPTGGTYTMTAPTPPPTPPTPTPTPTPTPSPSPSPTPSPTPSPSPSPTPTPSPAPSPSPTPGGNNSGGTSNSISNSTTTRPVDEPVPTVKNTTDGGYFVAVIVTDAASRTVTGATVSMDNGITVQSDSTGLASFVNVAPGAHTVKISNGSQKKEGSILVNANDPTAVQQFTFKLPSKNSFPAWVLPAIGGGLLLIGLLAVLRKPVARLFNRSHAEAMMVPGMVIDGHKVDGNDPKL